MSVALVGCCIAVALLARTSLFWLSSLFSHFFFAAMDAFARTPVGKEFFRRLWLASDCCFCADLHLSSSCFVDLVTSDVYCN